MGVVWTRVERKGLLQHADFLEPCADPPLCLSADRHFQQLCLGAHCLPMGGMPSPKQVAARHHPPSGLQLLPGHSLHFTLRVAWPSTYRPAASHWPRAWNAHYRTWHMHPCARHTFAWLPGPWLLASPTAMAPVQVAYKPLSQHAEWTFELRER
jgi:hypothetical protein